MKITSHSLDSGYNPLAGRMYGSTDNTALDWSAMGMLLDINENIYKNRELMGKIPVQKGAVENSDYEKQAFGSVPVGNFNIPLKDCRAQYVHIKSGGVSEHPHPEGEWYLMTEDSGTGVLKHGDESIPLEPGMFYSITPGVAHGLTPNPGQELGVIVFKFSPELQDNYTVDNSLGRPQPILG
jgi:mannose-6-phosphate isomerase-like protein (cupin superfamily)